MSESDSFLETYMIGFQYYPTIYNDLQPHTRFVYCIRVAYNFINAIVVLVLLGLFWSENTMVIQVLGLIYALFLLLLLGCPLYFQIGQPTFGIPELIEKERKRQKFQQCMDTLFFPILIIASWKVFSSVQVAQFTQDNLPLYHVTLAYTIMGYCYLCTPIIIAVIAILLLPCLWWNQRLREEAKIRAMGASEELINSIPVFMFRKPEVNPELGQIPIETIPSGPQPQPKKKFKIMSWKKKSQESQVQEPMFLELGQEDAHCSICLAEYEDGESLRQLRCNHHYHVSCIDEWLKLNAKCPLCVQGITKK